MIDYFIQLLVFDTSADMGYYNLANIVVLDKSADMGYYIQPSKLYSIGQIWTLEIFHTV